MTNANRIGLPNSQRVREKLIAARIQNCEAFLTLLEDRLFKAFEISSITDVNHEASFCINSTLFPEMESSLEDYFDTCRLLEAWVVFACAVKDEPKVKCIVSTLPFAKGFKFDVGINYGKIA